MYTLYNWELVWDSDGYFRCTGELYNGKEWQTSAVDQLTTTRDGYRVVTRNSVYFLPC